MTEANAIILAAVSIGKDLASQPDWNPLEDEKDSLELSSKLKLQISYTEGHTIGGQGCVEVCFHRSWSTAYNVTVHEPISGSGGTAKAQMKAIFEVAVAVGAIRTVSS